MATTAPSILLIRASGLLGKAVMEALIAQKHDFVRIGVLVHPSRAHKFKHVAQGVDQVIGFYLDSDLY